MLLLMVRGAAAEPSREAPYFLNIAPQAGLADVSAQRVVWVDLDGDGWLDCALNKTRVFHSIADPEKPGGRRFEDVTDTCGLNLTRAGENGDEQRPTNVLIFGDIDNDGDQDAYSAIYCDFLKPKADPETGDPLIENGRIVYEIPDNGWRSEIFLNDGRGHFTRLENSGVNRNPATTCAAAFLDCDKDGFLDLYEGNWYTEYGFSFECYQSRIYQGAGNGCFTDATDLWRMTTIREPGYHNSSKPTYGVTHTDWNNDGWQDILVESYGRQWNELWMGGPQGFTEVGEATRFDGDEDRSGIYPPEIAERGYEQEAPFRSNGNTFDCTAVDFNNDGFMDCFIGEITHWWAGPSSDVSTFLINGGPSKGWTFTHGMCGIVRQHASDHWNQGDIHTGALDFDNDGLLDLIIASSDYPDGQYLKLYKQLPDHTFTEVTRLAGFDWEGSGGVSIADFNRDGKEDILVGKSFMRLPPERTEGRIPAPALFLNQCENGNHWIGIFCEGAMRPGDQPGSGSNRSAIGARITVTCGDVTQTREILGGAGHAGHQNPPEAHFGLGQAEVIDRLAIRWSDRNTMVDTFENLPVDCFIRLDEATHSWEIVNSRLPLLG